MSEQGRIACRHSTPLDGCSHTGDPCDGCPRRVPPPGETMTVDDEIADLRLRLAALPPGPEAWLARAPFLRRLDVLCRISAEHASHNRDTLATHRAREATYDLAPLHEAAAKLREIGDARQALEEELFPTPAPPYDPKPPTKAKAIDGWVWCDACGVARPATGHDCDSPEITKSLLEMEVAHLTDLLTEARRLVYFSAKDLREREGEDSVLCELVEEEQFVKDATAVLGPLPEIYGDAARTGGRPR